jgi:hypothetical protein
VIGDLPLSLRQTVMWCQSSKRANFDCSAVPRSSLSASQMARRAVVVKRLRDLLWDTEGMPPALGPEGVILLEFFQLHL